MIRLMGLCAVLVVLVACGADGAPERPTTGLTVTGEARLGVTSP